MRLVFKVCLILLFVGTLHFKVGKTAGCPFDKPNLPSNIEEKYIDSVAFRGDSLTQFFTSVRDLNTAMNVHYKTMIRKIGQNTFPLIIASDSESGSGTTFTLFLKNGSVHRITPIAPQYEMYKSLSHTAVGLFTILAPYFKSPESTGWQHELLLYHDQVIDVKNALDSIKMDSDSNFSSSDKAHAEEMLSVVLKFINHSFENNSVNLIDFIKFSNELYPFVVKSMEIAAKIQVYSSIPAIQKWKDELGFEWRNLYVVIPTVWAVSERNTRQQMFEELMDEGDQKSTKIIIAEGAKNVDEARDVLGRIVVDRAMAEVIFGRTTNKRFAYATSLSSRKDLIESNCKKALDEYFGRV